MPLKKDPYDFIEGIVEGWLAYEKERLIRVCDESGAPRFDLNTEECDWTAERINQCIRAYALGYEEGSTIEKNWWRSRLEKLLAKEVVSPDNASDG